MDDHKSLGDGGGGDGARKMMRNALILVPMIDDILMHKIKCGKIKSQQTIVCVTVCALANTIGISYVNTFFDISFDLLRQVFSVLFASSLSWFFVCLHYFFWSDIERGYNNEHNKFCVVGIHTCFNGFTGGINKVCFESQNVFFLIPLAAV